jgi:hypothetical protein
VAVGRDALGANTTASNNTAVGYQAGYSTTTGQSNTAVGYQAGYSNTTGGDNVSVGNLAGTNSTGGANTFLGAGAGTNATSGDYNLYVGVGSRQGTAGNSYEMVICTSNVAVPGKGSSTGFISAGGSGGIYNGGNTTTWTTTSDQRLKKNIVDNNTGLEKINAIQVRNFEYRLPEEVDAELEPKDAIKKSGVQLGVIAQELQQVLPECVKTESTGVMSVDTDNLIWYAINAIKQLSAEVESLKSQLNQGA